MKLRVLFNITRRLIKIMEQILVLSTGGTFDKTYDLLTGTTSESFVSSILTLGRSTLETEARPSF